MKTVFCLFVLILVEEICVARKEANFIRFANCPEYKNYTALFKNIVLGKNKNGRTVSMRFNIMIKKEIKRMMVLVTMKKCDNSESLDSCEYYIQDFKVNNACDVMGKQGQVWSDALSNSNFPRGCPISEGIYNLNDTKLDSNLQLTLLPVPIALWKIKFKTYDSGNDNVMVSCSDLDVKVYSVKRNS